MSTSGSPRMDKLSFYRAPQLAPNWETSVLNPQLPTSCNVFKMQRSALNPNMPHH